MNWNEKLHEHIMEEEHGYEEYMTLAKMAEEEGCHDAACILKDIAHEEMTHEKLLREMSEKYVKKPIDQ